MLIVAHRGASALAPENTIAAFARALADGAPAVEFDVRLSKNGRLVVMHDDEVERTTGRGGRISDMTLAEIEQLDAGWPDVPAAVPTFEQVLELLAGKVILYVEVKGAWTGQRYIPAAPVVDAILPFMERAVDAVVSSFDPDAVAHVRTVAPHLKTGIASLELVDASWALQVAVDHALDECHVPEAQIDEFFLRAAHDAGKRVLGWTVNDPARAIDLARIGCDGVFTDDPASLAEALVGSSGDHGQRIGD